MLKKTITASAALGLLSLTIASPSLAQFSPNNSSGPTDISADSANVVDNNVLRLKGQVDIRQGDTRILADAVDVSTNGSANDLNSNDFERVVATGNFYYLTPGQEVRGEKGVYEKSSETFTVTGNVILLQGEDNVVTGDRLIYNLTTNEARIVGSCKGRKCGRKGRVNILIKNSGSQNQG